MAAWSSEPQLKAQQPEVFCLCTQAPPEREVASLGCHSCGGGYHPQCLATSSLKCSSHNPERIPAPFQPTQELTHSYSQLLHRYPTLSEDEALQLALVTAEGGNSPAFQMQPLVDRFLKLMRSYCNLTKDQTLEIALLQPPEPREVGAGDPLTSDYIALMKSCSWITGGEALEVCMIQRGIELMPMRELARNYMELVGPYSCMSQMQMLEIARTRGMRHKDVILDRNPSNEKPLPTGPARGNRPEPGPERATMMCALFDTLPHQNPAKSPQAFFSDDHCHSDEAMTPPELENLEIATVVDLD
eukprot:TRINITY_DN6215_c0_g1_i1.p1 TRINITY_DN6215_c0_g1~~TRINITY_DN6215_c0_g1_i1.p1  ORF type:complete len:302 (+),score=66.87 TRINITY_DN6215_c0_g1_i1:373-1278(+)